MSPNYLNNICLNKMEKKQEFANIDFFENCVLKENKNYPGYFILSSYYRKHADPKRIYLSKLSIFDKDRGTVKKDKAFIKGVLDILMTDKNPEEKKELLKKFKLTIKEKRAIGSMLGMAIGDAMGARYEFKKVRYDEIDLKGMDSKYSNFNMEPGQWTDDTSMGLCLADSLLMNKGELDPHDLMKRFLCWWYGGYNNAFKKNATPRHSVGLGGNISQSFKRYFKYQEEETGAGDENTSGNGSIMRNAAIPICFHKIDEIKNACEMARMQSRVTHQGKEAKECCALLTHIIVNLLNRKNDEDEKEEKKEKLKDILFNYTSSFNAEVDSVKYLANSQIENNDNINRNWNWRVPQYYYSKERVEKNPGYIGSYAMDNMVMSLNVLYTTESFKDAIIKIVNIRGDSDSVASVVGQMAGAFYPIESIPGDWINAIYNNDDGEIALRGYMLSRLSENASYIIKKDEANK